MVGFAVTGIVFVALYAAFSGGFATIQLLRENLRATQIMVEKMETLRLYTWEQLTNSNWTPPDGGSPTNFIPRTFTAAYYQAGTNTFGVNYSGTMEILPAPISASYSNDLRLIRVELTWESGKVTRVREMHTLVARNGLQHYIY